MNTQMHQSTSGILVPLFSHFLPYFEHGKVKSMLDILINNLQIHIQKLGQICKKQSSSFYEQNTRIFQAMVHCFYYISVKQCSGLIVNWYDHLL